MNQQSWIRLAYARPHGPIAIILLFVLCSTPFMLLGSLLNTSYSSITALPLYPNAQAFTLTTKSTVGMMSTPTTSQVPAPNSIPNYMFATTDTPEAVAKFYQNSITQIYGRQAVQTSTSQSGQPNQATTITAARRPVGGSTEQTTITINTGQDGLTHVLVMVETH